MLEFVQEYTTSNLINELVHDYIVELNWEALQHTNNALRKALEMIDAAPSARHELVVATAPDCRLHAYYEYLNTLTTDIQRVIFFCDFSSRPHYLLEDVVSQMARHYSKSPFEVKSGPGEWTTDSIVYHIGVSYGKLATRGTVKPVSEWPIFDSGYVRGLVVIFHRVGLMEILRDGVE